MAPLLFLLFPLPVLLFLPPLRLSLVVQVFSSYFYLRQGIID
jgi:hypothetical protein